MGTEIKNTLFRFVTMRAPELPQPGKTKTEFISHPETLDSISHFLSGLQYTVTRKEYLKSKVRNFREEAFTSVKQVEAFVGHDFYFFANWITSNRSKLTVEEAERLLPGAGLNEKQTLALWDNLFYQILTSASPYVRDLILSLLVADFFISERKRTIKLTTADARKLAQARVIVPKSLVGIVVNTDAPEKVKRHLRSLPVSTKHLDADAKAGLAAARIKSLEGIKAELARAKQLYDKQNGEALKTARSEYDFHVKDILAKASYQEKVYINPETNIEWKYKEYDRLEFPEFSYTPADEIKSEVVTSNISEEARAYLDNQMTMRGIASLEAAIQQTTADIQAEYQNLTPNSGVMVNNFGIIPVIIPTVPPAPTTPGTPAASNGVFNINSTAYQNTTGNTSLLVVIDNMPAGLDLVSANYTITFNDNSSITKSADYTDVWVNGKLHLTLFTSNINIRNKTSFTLTGVFTDTTGGTVNFTGNGKIESKAVTVGFVGRVFYEAKGNGRATYTRSAITDDNGQEVHDAEVVTEYTPSGFGIKRLGIADYRKVEQEVCCYVPGEVSHIENIMAREYREKSTRRLSRSETTTTTSSEQEKEKLTDTSTTDRFEMNREAASVIAEDKAIGAHASVTANMDPYTITAGGNFAYNTSKEDSESQAIMQAKDVTERALERVVQKVKEERIVKVLEEFEENNKHGFDNREGSEHVSGVYRWVDKIYKNKIINYGKRLMYEFMIPEPAAFHAKATLASNGLVPPVDPRIGTGMVKIESADKITPSNYQYWAGQYGAEVDAPAFKMEFSDAFSKVWNNDANSSGRFANATEKIVEIPEGYKVTWYKGYFTFYHAGNTIAQISNATDANHKGTVTVGKMIYPFLQQSGSKIPIANVDEIAIEKTISVAVTSWDLGSFASNITFTCEKTEDAKKQWQLETYNAIIAAYEVKLKQYEQKLAELKASNIDKSRVNPLFYRNIENMALRKSCIAYLASHANMGLENMVVNRGTMDVIQNYTSPELERYAALVKFMEQAFEWDIISYKFYPYYWADKAVWKDLYNIDNDDPVFRSFLQSGMARVIVTVRPGFEEAVNWYMGTGQIWNGGPVPTLNDELFISIVDELKNPESVVEETWESRVPTSLTVIQAGSIGLLAEGLPCNPDCQDYTSTNENGEVVDNNPIKQQTSLIGGTKTDPAPAEAEPVA